MSQKVKDFSLMYNIARHFCLANSMESSFLLVLAGIKLVHICRAIFSLPICSVRPSEADWIRGQQLVAVLTSIDARRAAEMSAAATSRGGCRGGGGLQTFFEALRLNIMVGD